MSRPLSSAYDSSRGYGSSATDFAGNNPSASSPLSQSMQHHTPPASSSLAQQPSDRTTSSLADYNRTTSSLADHHDGGAGGSSTAPADRPTSTATTAVPPSTPSRSNTLKKRSSMRRVSSLKRSSSRRSLQAGNLAGFGGVDSDKDDFNSAFSTPIPTQGTPTEILANRFQAWRQLLKSLITYFREIQASYEQRAKATHKVQGLMSNISHPAIFMSENGLSEATRVLDEYHKRSLAEANKSREIENDVIQALTGLRSDLGQKIKEIKSLSGDFKNTVEKEKDGTRREVEKLQEALRAAEHDDGSAVGRNDPFVVRLGVDRAIEKQIDEENYLHRAYLNLESSGRELESIVVGEIQKAYNALAGILKREGDDAHHAVDALRTGPISMPKDAEWQQFVSSDPHFVDPRMPLRRVPDISYPGRHHPAAAEVRAGMLERKSKYLKSYTPGWYVLSSTHLHEFKSADRIAAQSPVMSLYLPDQKLGSHSAQTSSSHKFMLKGKQSGTSMHKGHNWVFRAESFDTMMAWFEALRVLTETRGEERTAFVRKHARSISGGPSEPGTLSSDGFDDDDDDEADAVPYSADAALLRQGDGAETMQTRVKRPAPGGRFPSDLQVLQLPARERAVSAGLSSGSEEGTTGGDGVVMGEGYLGVNGVAAQGVDPYRLDGVEAGEEKDPYRLQGVDAGSVYTAGTAGEEEDDDEGEMKNEYGGGEGYMGSEGGIVQPQPQPQTHVPTREISRTTENHHSTGQDHGEGYESSFLVDKPADARMESDVVPTSAPLAETDDSGAGWIGPAAVAGVVGGAAVAAVVNEDPGQRDQEVADGSLEKEARAGEETTKTQNTRTDAVDTHAIDQAGIVTRNEMPPPALPDHADTAISEHGPAILSNQQPTFNESTTTNETLTTDTSPIPPDPAANSTTLGGLEAEGARETGRFPAVIRHNTAMSVSELHVPGEFPKKE